MCHILLRLILLILLRVFESGRGSPVSRLEISFRLPKAAVRVVGWSLAVAREDRKESLDWLMVNLVWCLCPACTDCFSGLLGDWAPICDRLSFWVDCVTVQQQMYGD